jgi:hypothetical protein
MKTLLHALTVACCGLAVVHAEDPPPPSPGKGGGDMRRYARERFRDNLPPEIRQRFDAARAKALQDPKIQDLRKAAETANREFIQAVRKKMMEIDPELKEIVEKARAERGSSGRREGGEGWGFSQLTDTEKEKLQAAREKAKEDPAVRTAAKARDDAATPEARKAASEEFRRALHDALLKADPSLGPVLEKMAAPKLPPGGPVPAEGREAVDPE